MDMHKRLSHVAGSLLSSEQLYVASLETAAKKYLVPLQAEAKRNGYLKDEDVRTLFSTWCLLIDLHSMFLAGLEPCVLFCQEQGHLGEYLFNSLCFLDHYSEYFSNYDLAIKRLEELKTRPEFLEFISNICSRPPGSLSLESYLILPIQRTSSYEKLLAELLCYIPETDPDWCKVNGAIEMVRKVNERLEEQRRASKVTQQLTIRTTTAKARESRARIVAAQVLDTSQTSFQRQTLRVTSPRTLYDNSVPSRSFHLHLIVEERDVNFKDFFIITQRVLPGMMLKEIIRQSPEHRTYWIAQFIGAGVTLATLGWREALRYGSCKITYQVQLRESQLREYLLLINPAPIIKDEKRPVTV